MKNIMCVIEFGYSALVVLVISGTSNSASILFQGNDMTGSHPVPSTQVHKFFQGGNLMKNIWKKIGNYLKAVSILVACAAVCGCASHINNEMQIEMALTAPLSKARSVAIQVPTNGVWVGDKSTIYAGSGQQTAAVFQEMFSRYAKSVLLVKCQRSDCERSDGYFVELQILNWEEWNHAGSDNMDRVTIRVTVFDAVTDKIIASNILEASGYLGVGISTKDLLKPLIAGYVQSLY